MKNWIKVIFALDSKLDALTYSIDSQVDCLSKVIGGDTLELFDNIMRLNDKKVRLINLRVLHDKMKEALSERELIIITQSAKGKPLSEIADMLGLSRSHIYRLHDRAVLRLIKLLRFYGYDNKRFTDDYSDMTLINKMYKKLAKLDKAS